MSSTSAVSATPESTVIYTEKLWPTAWIWLIALGLSVAGILMFIPISTFAGYAAAVIMFILQAVILITSTPRIEVTADSLQVGRAHISREYIGEVTAFRGDAATAERGPRLNGLSYLCIRGWINPIVKIEITDQTDQTPYWLASSRRPEKLVAALTRGR
jgi:hypothetical protein